MHASLNEIESLCKKAARGAGMSWGLAEEAGKAAKWLFILTSWSKRLYIVSPINSRTKKQAALFGLFFFGWKRAAARNF